MSYKNISVIFLSFLTFFTVSCDEDLLDTVPKGTVSTAIYWNTEDDAVLAVNALYNFLDDTEIFQNDGMSDIARGNGEFSVLGYYERGEQDASITLGTNRWNSAYRAIRAVNEFLANVDQIETEDIDLINRLKGEARFMRAYHYTELVMLFGDVPLVTEPISIEEGRELTRTGKEQVLDFIAAELEESAGFLPESYDNKDQGRITKGAASGFKARAMLFAGRYAEAHQAAKAVMDLGIYSLYPSYEHLFSYEAENNKEVILDKQFIPELKTNSVFAMLAPNSQRSSNSSIVPTKDIVDAYEMKNGLPITDPDSGFDPFNPYESRDPRLGYSIFVLGDTLPDGQIYDPRPGFGGSDDITRSFVTTSTGFNIQKYINPEDLEQPGKCSINIILMRYPEILLTYAEAKIEAGEIDQSVYDAINEVRQRPDVNLPPITGSKSREELREIVRHERKVELAFEGQHFFDIRRWKIAEEVMNGPIKGMTYVNQNGELETAVYGSFQRFFDPAVHYLWPIPRKEMELNKNLTQNSGY